MIKNTIYLIIAMLMFSCAGTIKTTNYTTRQNTNFKKAYIISAENSQYIEFKLGIITPFGIIVQGDDPATTTEVIGNTDLVIKEELSKYGIQTVIGKNGDTPDDFDLIVMYSDTWRWDMKNILDKLDIYFISASGDSLIAKSTFNIYKNKEMHNFPTPEKEVPRMIKELLNK